MTEQECYVRCAAGVFKHCLKILDHRSLKYTGEDAPFSNFESSAHIADTDILTGIMTRFGDKVGRIKAGLRAYAEGSGGPAFEDESLTDSLTDAINYLAIIRIYLETGGGADFEPFLTENGMIPPRQQEIPFPEESQKDGGTQSGGWFKNFIKQ